MIFKTHWALFLLIHLISLDPNDNSDIISAYETIVNELKQYKQSLVNKPIVLVANKIDQIGALENLQILKEHLKDNQYIKVISALTNLHVDAMLDDVIKIYFDQKDLWTTFKRTFTSWSNFKMSKWYS